MPVPKLDPKQKGSSFNVVVRFPNSTIKQIRKTAKAYGYASVSEYIREAAAAFPVLMDEAVERGDK